MTGIDAATLGEAIAMQPLWLKSWMYLLGAINLASIFFVLKRVDGKWRLRLEAIAILISFFAAGAFMEWLYAQYGYVRLLGLAHLIFWTPAYAWIFRKRKQLVASAPVFGKYILAYLVINGISLIIDSIDVVRYFTGTA
ncbi:hypothetical protein [Parasphingorhabdus halotolerans]|uniref:Uncharacterized protein n=1 Tax=Parasphingorhabdus halotolerans TaxID=2725558 RepID=A0A6H2DLA7_9SPHN|nr:hypothetical protein [Parasphingorhabdus halotolerans]QJB69170.1 hypothetical protein HF685_07675 [Parasphingorhabdus halotolerans]